MAAAENIKNKYICDMTEGNEAVLLLRFTVPMLIGNIFQQFYNMADSMVVGKFINSNALGAVGVVGSLTFLFFSLCMGLGSGLGILISQYFGAGSTEYVKKTIANSIYITLAAGVLMSICGVILARPVLTWMHTPAENFDYALTYMRIVCGATLVVAVYNMISAVLRALGDSKTPLCFLVAACIINVALDLLFVVVFRMGIAGAALATIIAQFFAALGSICYAVCKNPYLRLEARHFAPEKEIILKGCKLGLPIAAQNAMIALSCVALQSVVNHFGPMVLAAFTATSRVEELVHQPLNSLGTAFATFAGQNVGAKRYDRVSSGCKKCVLIILVFCLAMILLVHILGSQIIGLFIREPEVIAIGAKGLQLTSWMYIFLGLIYLLRGMLNGVGDAVFAMVNGIVEVIGRVGFAYILMLFPAVGMWGVWLTNGLTWILAGLANLARVLRGTWKSSP